MSVWYCSNNDMIFLAVPFCYDGVDEIGLFCEMASGRCYLIGEF
jgi:hypothetical protein